MRILILIFSFISWVVDFLLRFGLIICCNITFHEKRLFYLKKVIAYVEANAPNSTYVRCGKDLEGRQGCLVMTENYEAFEANQSFWETDEEWNRLMRLAWKECGIDDFGFGRKALTFE